MAFNLRIPNNNWLRWIGRNGFIITNAKITIGVLNNPNPSMRKSTSVLFVLFWSINNVWIGCQCKKQLLGHSKHIQNELLILQWAAQCNQKWNIQCPRKLYQIDASKSDVCRNVYVYEHLIASVISVVLIEHSFMLCIRVLFVVESILL